MSGAITTEQTLSQLITKLSKSNMDDESQEKMDVSINTPFGELSVDLYEFESARNKAINQMKTKCEISAGSRLNEIKLARAFFESKKYTEYGKFWPSTFGCLIKSHLDTYFENDRLVEEFFCDGNDLVQARYMDMTLSNGKSLRFITEGIRLYEMADGSKIVLTLSVDRDNDHFINIYSNQPYDCKNMIDDFLADFFKRGPLKGQFFDIDYNFMDRNPAVNDLLVWDSDVKQILEREIVQYFDIMPSLKKMGMPTSRGLILSGPPGTGKTMYAKALAASCDVTTILISAEMVKQRYDVKSAFILARKLAPCLIIIEDIDTAGTVSRKFSNHPILGEYLQSMDGIEANDGVVVLATTNHTENIDPAITDRPGRFDRIINVDLPSKRQRMGIILNLLNKFDHDELSDGFVLRMAKKTEGLSGAWIKECIHSSFIQASYDGRDKISQSDIEDAVSEVIERRGHVFVPTKVLPNANPIANGYTA